MLEERAQSGEVVAPHTSEVADADSNATYASFQLLKRRDSLLVFARKADHRPFAIVSRLWARDATYIK